MPPPSRGHDRRTPPPPEFSRDPVGLLDRSSDLIKLSDQFSRTRARTRTGSVTHQPPLKQRIDVDAKAFTRCQEILTLNVDRIVFQHWEIRLMQLRRLTIVIATIFPLLTPNLASAQDSIGNRMAAAERYAAVADIEKMMNDSIRTIAQSFPANQREDVIAKMRREIDIQWLRNLMINSMVQIFTVEELNALADFYGNSVGRSIVRKMPAYFAAFMPAMQQRLIDAAR